MDINPTSPDNRSPRPVVVYASDGNDIDFLNASIFTVRKFAKGEVDIYVLSDFINPDEVPEATKVIDPTPLLSSLGFFSAGWARRWPYATLYRMAIPLISEFRDMERVLYLDTDILMKNAGLEDLFDRNYLDIGNHEIFAVKDTNGTWERIRKCVREDLGLKESVKIIEKLWFSTPIEGRTYANAGVALWCVKNILNNGLDWYEQRLRWFWEAELRCKFEYLDQDFINSMMDMGPPLHDKYNYYANSKRQESDVGYDVVFKHYITHTKGSIVKDAIALGYNNTNSAFMDNEEPKIIVYSSDGRDADKLRLSAASARMYLGSNVKFYILTELEKYPGFPNATLVNPTNALKEVGFSKETWNAVRWPFASMYRLALPLLEEFKDIDKLLYLDTDTLIRSHTANYLFRMESNGFEAYGAQDVEDRQFDIEKLIKNGFSGGPRRELREKIWRKREKVTQGYVNSGVLLEFLSEIRKNGLDWYKNRLKWFFDLSISGKFTFPDQTFINMMMDISPSLSVRFNRFGGDFGTNCVIQHFVGNMKSNMQKVANRMGIHI